MSRLSMVHAVLAATSLLGTTLAVDANAQVAFSIDVQALEDNNCFGAAICALNGADISIIAPATGRVLEKKMHNDATGFGVSGGPSGAEIDVGETLRVELNDDTTDIQSRSITAIRILFLYNGPEYSDRAEKVEVTVDGGAVYTLSTSSFADDVADWTGPGRVGWSGPGKVDNCDGGATTLAGTGCFTITDPFPGAVSRLDFTAIAGGAPFAGAGTNESDYSIEFIDVAADVLVNLGNCADPLAGCPVASVGGQVAAAWNSMQVTNPNPGGSLDSIMRQVKLPDCRYNPQACLVLLGESAPLLATDNDKRGILIDLGVIKSLDPSGPNKLNPATQLLNVTPLLPDEVTDLFVGPNVLPSLYIHSRWRGQVSNDYFFDGLFFKTDSGLVFTNTFGGLIDVSVLTGNELGCFADPSPTANLLLWDVITSASELAKSVGGRYIDTMINVGCQNPTKVSGVRLSLQSVNLEMVPATYGPTIKSFKSKVTENNDAVFARLVESLWKAEGEILGSFACKQADTLPTGGLAPLSSTVCNSLASKWAVADLKIKLCVNATFYPASSYRDWICGLASEYVNKFEAALPTTATGPDVRNRLGELKARVEVFEHVWTERFMRSVSNKPTGFCREWGTCPL